MLKRVQPPPVHPDILFRVCYLSHYNHTDMPHIKVGAEGDGRLLTMWVGAIKAQGPSYTSNPSKENVSKGPKSCKPWCGIHASTCTFEQVFFRCVIHNPKQSILLMCSPHKMHHIKRWTCLEPVWVDSSPWPPVHIFSTPRLDPPRRVDVDKHLDRCFWWRWRRTVA